MKHEIGMCDFDDSYDWQPSNKKNDKPDLPRGVKATPSISIETREPVPAATKRNAISLAEWVIKNRDANSLSFGEKTAWSQGIGFIKERDTLNSATRVDTQTSDTETIEIKAKPLEQFITPTASPAASRTLALAL